MAQLNFDARNVDPSQSAGQLPVSGPEGHPVVIVSSEVKPTKENDGGYLQLDLQVIDGPNKGEGGSFRLNLYNKEPKAVEIAYKQLSAICHATGIFQVADSSQLHGQPFRVVVSAQKANPEYTEVKKILDIQGNEPGKPPANQQQPAPGGFGGQPQAQPQAQPQNGFQQPAQQPQGGGFQQPAPGGNWQQGQQPAAAPWGPK